jgi:uncharacterized tellurite resistance protein B-like protein
MPIKALRAWLGVDQPATPEHAPLRELIESLDRLEIGQAKHLARFAYLLGRVACADREVSAEETATMERLVAEHGRLTEDQSALVVGMAKTSNLMFGGTADFAVTKEFTDNSTYDDKLALARCLFAVAATDQSISLAEEAEIHRIVNQLRILPDDLMKLRVEHRAFLPGLTRPAR